MEHRRMSGITEGDDVRSQSVKVIEAQRSVALLTVVQLYWNGSLTRPVLVALLAPSVELAWQEKGGNEST